MTSKMRAVHRLVTEVVLLGGDAPAWTERLLEGTRELFQAKMAALAMCPLPTKPGEFVRSDVLVQRGFTPAEVRHWSQGYWGEGNEIRSEFLRRCGMIRSRFVTVRRRDLMSDEEWYAGEAFQRIHKVLGVDDHLTSLVIAPAQGRLFGFALHKHIDTEPYTVNDRRQFRVLHLELARAWQKAIVAPMSGDADVRCLSPRLREVLWLLCSGKSEKEVAIEIGLSAKTIHNHVVRLHKHFGVRSRGELLARVLNRSAQVSAVSLPEASMNVYAKPE